MEEKIWFDEKQAFLRRCSCGGEPEIIADRNADESIRCKVCHLGTCWQDGREDSVRDWNEQIDLRKVETFRDHLPRNLYGDLAAICIRRDEQEVDFYGLSDKEQRFNEAVLVYPDRLVKMECCCSKQGATAEFEPLSAFNREVYCCDILPPEGKTMRVSGVLFREEDGEPMGLALRWGSGWMHIVAHPEGFHYDTDFHQAMEGHPAD